MNNYERTKLKIRYFLGEVSYAEAFPKETVMFRGLEIEIDPVVSTSVFNTLVSIITGNFSVPSHLKNEEVPEYFYD